MNAPQQNPQAPATNVYCGRCGLESPLDAQYCGRCGQPLTGQPEGPRRDALLNLALVVCALIVVASGLLAWRIADKPKRSAPREPVVGSVQRSWDLPRDKAAALYNLLAPSDVRVLVGRVDGGISVTGTPREIESIDQFVELLTRLEGLQPEQIDAKMRPLRRTWTTTRDYEGLPSSKARALLAILAFDDVPVLVSPPETNMLPWRWGSSVRVQASPADQETVDKAVDILRGQ